jgi:hypothetical protein
MFGTECLSALFQILRFGLALCTSDIYLANYRKNSNSINIQITLKTL